MSILLIDIDQQATTEKQPAPQVVVTTTYTATSHHYDVIKKNGNIFRVTGPLWGESTCLRRIPLTVDSPHKGQWHRALLFSLLCAWRNGWANNGDAGDLTKLASWQLLVFSEWRQWPLQANKPQTGSKWVWFQVPVSESHTSPYHKTSRNFAVTISEFEVFISLRKSVSVSTIIYWSHVLNLNAIWKSIQIRGFEIWRDIASFCKGD